MKKEVYLSNITISFNLERFDEDYNKENLLEFLKKNLSKDCFYFVDSTFLRSLHKLVVPAINVEIKEAFKGEKPNDWFVVIEVKRPRMNNMAIDGEFIYRKGDYFITQTAIPFSGDVVSVLHGESIE